MLISKDRHQSHWYTISSPILVHRTKQLLFRFTSVGSYLNIFPYVTDKVDPDQAALTWVCSVCKSVKRCLYEVKG